MASGRCDAIAGNPVHLHQLPHYAVGCFDQIWEICC